MDVLGAAHNNLPAEQGLKGSPVSLAKEATDDRSLLPAGPFLTVFQRRPCATQCKTLDKEKPAVSSGFLGGAYYRDRTGDLRLAKSVSALNRASAFWTSRDWLTLGRRVSPLRIVGQGPTRHVTRRGRKQLRSARTARKPAREPGRLRRLHGPRGGEELATSSSHHSKITSGNNGNARGSLVFGPSRTAFADLAQSCGLSARPRTDPNDRRHLPCRRSWVRVPSSASSSSLSLSLSPTEPRIGGFYCCLTGA